MPGYHAVPSPRGIGAGPSNISIGGSQWRGGGVQQQPSKFAQNMAKSMTIDEMRYLHQRALNDAEAKRTELKLVLASRYRELVGSSDEVIKMKERAQELHDLVQALPSLMEKLVKPHPSKEDEAGEASKQLPSQSLDPEQETILRLRMNLSNLPRAIYRALDRDDVHAATITLIELFKLIAEHTDKYPLANTLSRSQALKSQELKRSGIVDGVMEIQIRMIFLQVQTLPDKICRVASKFLTRSASFGSHIDTPILGAQLSASALASLHLLVLRDTGCKADWLLATYFDSKATLLVSQLEKLMSPQSDNTNQTFGAGIAEGVLSKIVLILQYDIILHPYQIFIRRDFRVERDGDASHIMNSLPQFDQDAVRAKASKFLLTHLQLIRTKVKSVLVSIAGTTASALGQIRQSLYDKTDGLESIQSLNENGVCTWDDAVSAMVDIPTVFNHGGDASHDITTQKFSIWGALFSSTFSSLVHSLLTTAFQSVHTSVISSLRSLLTNAPSLTSILPHEAYMNTLKIATNLNEALLKVSQDAHELLVHAEERIESERRLRQSLYVQTCEIMGRLICELRRMAASESDEGDEGADATKDLIIGRLCYLLKFRLTSLPTLLSPESSPVSMRSTIGMISFVDLKSAFELADHGEDGLITFEEAIEAVESAFAGTPFHGAEMVRETLLLSTEGNETKPVSVSQLKEMPSNVTLGELSLLTARGLRHEKAGTESALGILQQCLDFIADDCFRKWSAAVLKPATNSFRTGLQDFMITATGMNDEEWQRIFSNSEGPIVASLETNCKGVSPYFIGFILECASIVSRNTCPSDWLPAVPNNIYLASLGIEVNHSSTQPTLTETVRQIVMNVALNTILSLLDESLHTSSASRDLQVTCSLALVQLYADVKFFERCVQELSGSRRDLSSTTRDVFTEKLKLIIRTVESVLNIRGVASKLVELNNAIDAKHQHILESSDLFFSTIFDGERKAKFSASGELIGTATGNTMFYTPISSTRRFVLLPVQADHSLNDIQLRGMYTKEKEQLASKQESSTGNVMTSGFGFFSSMLKKK